MESIVRSTGKGGLLDRRDYLACAPTLAVPKLIILRVCVNQGWIVKIVNQNMVLGLSLYYKFQNSFQNLGFLLKSKLTSNMSIIKTRDCLVNKVHSQILTPTASRPRHDNHILTLSLVAWL